MLNKIKLLLGLTSNDKDELIALLIESAIKEATTYTNNPDIANDNLICDMVVYKFNRLGTEGVNSENYSGVSFNYSTDYPENIMRTLKSLRKLKVF